MTELPDFAGSAYEELIKEQLAEERTRKGSLEQRGLAVVTSSGTLVTLLLAVGAVSANTSSLVVPTPSKILLGAALLAFAAAGAFGILVNKPTFIEEVHTEWLEKLVHPVAWDYSDSRLARRRTSEARVKSIKSFRSKTKKKVDHLTWAISAEVAAIALTACASIIMLFSVE